MQASVPRCARLVAALEDLTAQEAAALRTGDLAAVNELSDRIGVVIDALAADNGLAGAPALHDRVRGVQATRAATSTELARQMDEVREELNRTGAAQGRVARIAPVYGSKSAAAKPSTRLSYVG